MTPLRRLAAVLLPLLFLPDSAIAAGPTPVGGTGTIVSLLREPEPPSMTDAECDVLKRRIDFLRSPARKESLERYLSKERALLDQAGKSMEKAKAGALDALESNLIEIGAFGLPKIWNGNQGTLRARIAKLGPGDVRDKVLWIHQKKRLEDLVGKALATDLAVAKWTLSDLPALRLRAQEASRELASLGETATALAKEMAASGVHEDLVDLVAAFVPPAEVTNLIGKVVVSSALAGGEYAVAKRDLDALEADLGRVVLDANRGDLELRGLRRSFERNCVADLELRLALDRDAVERDRKALNAECGAVPKADAAKVADCERRKTDILRRMDAYKAALTTLKSRKETR